MGENPKNFSQSLIMADPVLNSFISERVTVNSNDLLSRITSGHDSTAYRSIPQDICKQTSCLYHLSTPRDTSVTTGLRPTTHFPKPILHAITYTVHL